MADYRPYTWKPTEIIEVTNVSDENLLLYLESGVLRVDKGRTVRLTASATDSHEIVALANAGKLQVTPFRKRKKYTRGSNGSSQAGAH
jgi:hypothetical protein